MWITLALDHFGSVNLSRCPRRKKAFAGYHAILKKMARLEEENEILKKAVIIYGSRARGDFKSTSDIDIAIFGEGDLSPELYFEVEEAVGIYKVDIVEVNRLHNEKLFENILKDSIEIYRKESS